MLFGWHILAALRACLSGEALLVENERFSFGSAFPPMRETSRRPSGLMAAKPVLAFPFPSGMSVVITTFCFSAADKRLSWRREAGGEVALLA